MSGFCFFGAYDPAYPRNALLRKGLLALGREVGECRVRGRKAWLRYPALVSRSKAAFRRDIEWLVVPEFRQKDMPLARLIGRLAGIPVIFDPLAARYETKILDWRRKPPGSAAAWWNRRIDRAAFRGADLVLADTAAHADYFVSECGLDPAKVAVLPVGYDDEMFDPARYEPNWAAKSAKLEAREASQANMGLESEIRASAFVTERPISIRDACRDDGMSADACQEGIHTEVREKAEATGAEQLSRSPDADGSGQDAVAEHHGVGAFTVLFHGSFLPLHGVESIIEAARIVGAADPEIRFSLCGSGQSLERSRATAVEFGLGNCDFRGWRPLEEVPADIASASICLGLFGRTEKARRVVPHKIYQAMGMGKAVVTARTAAVEEFFKDGESIRLCDEPYAESLAAAVLELKRDAALRTRLAAVGHALVRERFTARATAARLLEILDEKFGMEI